LRRCRKHYAERQLFFLDLVQQRGLPLTFPVTGHGMNLAGLLPDDVEDRSVSLRLQQVGLDVPALSRYRVASGQPGLLFGLAAFSTAEIARGVSTMHQALS
jgi:GntR family transcriptional regulator/MocR family aminotransferase